MDYCREGSWNGMVSVAAEGLVTVGVKKRADAAEGRKEKRGQKRREWPQTDQISKAEQRLKCWWWSFLKFVCLPILAV